MVLLSRLLSDKIHVPYLACQFMLAAHAGMPVGDVKHSGGWEIYFAELNVSSVFTNRLTVVVIRDTVDKQTNITNRTQTIKNPNLWKADQLAIYTRRSRRTWGFQEPDSGRVEDF